MSDTETKPSLNIFVVEDHEDTLSILRVYLKSIGHRVEVARSLAEALEAIPKDSYDVLMSDMGLPDGDGWDLLPRLKEAGAVLPRYAIAMSGFGMNADHERSERAGFNHHLLKPFTLEDLDEVLAGAKASFGKA